MNFAVASRTRFVDPIWITIAMWCFVLAGAMLSELNPLSPGFLAFLALGIASHLAGMATRRWLLPGRAPRGPAHADGDFEPAQILHAWRRGRRASWVLLAALALGVLFFLRAYAQIVPSLDPLGLIEMRNAYLEEVRGVRDKLFIYTTHLALLGIAAMFFAARNAELARRLGRAAPRMLVNLIAATAFSAGLLTTGRTAPLLVIIAYAFYGLCFRLYSKRRIVASFFVLALAMFFLVALALGKEDLGGDAGVLESLANIGKVYFFSAPAALQEVVVRGQSVSDVCSNILSYPIDLAKKFGYFVQCDARELDFVFVPVSTNVFTFMRAYWEDFGWGFAFALFGAGFLIESVHLAALQRDGFAAFIYPFVLNALLLQIFEEQLFANGSVLAYLIVFFLLLRVAFPPPRRDAAPSAVQPDPAAAPPEDLRTA